MPVCLNENRTFSLDLSSRFSSFLLSLPTFLRSSEMSRRTLNFTAFKVAHSRLAVVQQTVFFFFYNSHVCLPSPALEQKREFFGGDSRL